ncbi:MAG: amidohydrolase [Acidobacteriota bacterium]
MSMVIMNACSTPTSDSTVPADLVIWGGTIFTFNESDLTPEALAARDGIIVAVGSRASIEPLVGPETEVIELDRGLAIPGFIEAHAHFIGLGDSMIQLDLRSASSWDDIVDMVAAAAADAEPGQWIRGRGWHQDKWNEIPQPEIEGFPVHDSLSAVSPEHPVVLTHASGHAVFVNAEAMRRAGIDASTADPPGGDLLRDAAGQPTGLLRETAEGLINEARAGDDEGSEVRRMIRLASRECLAKGITSFQDAGSSFVMIDALRDADRDGDLGVRLWVMAMDDNDTLRSRLGEYLDKEETDNVRIGGIKRWLDGALGSRGAWLLEPYSDAPDDVGFNIVPVDDLREVAAIAREHEVQLCVHAIGDKANRVTLDVFAEFYSEAPDADLRWRIEHAQHLHPDDISRFAELGVVASVQPVHCTSDGPWVPERLGEQRSYEGAYVWRALVDSGAVLASGTDAPVEDVDPIPNFHAAVTRQMNDGEAFYPEQALTRIEALAAMTRDAAWAAFEEQEKGTLTVGKLADITVLSKDILTIPAGEILETEVVYTIVGGRVAYQR